MLTLEDVESEFGGVVPWSHCQAYYRIKKKELVGLVGEGGKVVEGEKVGEGKREKGEGDETGAGNGKRGRESEEGAEEGGGKKVRPDVEEVAVVVEQVVLS